MWFLILSAFLSTTTLPPDSPAVKGEKAKQLIEWNWEVKLSGWEIRFSEGKPAQLALINFEDHRIDIWVRENQTSAQVAWTVVHELVHAYDHVYFTPEMRQEWIKIRSLPVYVEWYPPCDCPDEGDGAGDFAEAVAWTLLSNEPRFQRKASFKNEIWFPPTAAQQMLIRKWLEIK